MSRTGDTKAESRGWARLADGAPAVGVLLFHLAFLRGYGVFRDELYYVACGKRPGWGYVDHPPLVAWVAWLAARIGGESHLVLRVVAAAAAAGAVFVASRLARELGGGPRARLLAGLGMAVAPVVLSLGSVYSMNAFDLLFWAVLFWVVARALRGGDQRLWLVFGAVAGLGLLNKVSVLFLGFGLAVGLVAARRWDVLRSRSFWLGGAIALAVFAPHLAWQQANGWPTLEFMANARRDKMVGLAPTGFLMEAALQTAPVAWLWVLGVAWLLLGRAAQRARALGVAFLTVLVVLVATGGKPYYLAAAYAAPMAAGAVAIEGWLGRARWRTPALTLLVLGVGLALSPFAAPVLPVEAYVRYAEAAGIGPSTDERHELSRLPQFYADMHGWRTMAEAVAAVVRGLPAGDRDRACIFGQNYGEAGAMEYFGPDLALPPAISGHNSYWLWGPGRCTGEVMIVLGDARGRLEELFEHVEEAGRFTCRDCMPYENHRRIWVARGLKVQIRNLWPQVKHFI